MKTNLLLLTIAAQEAASYLMMPLFKSCTGTKVFSCTDLSLKECVGKYQSSDVAGLLQACKSISRENSRQCTASFAFCYTPLCAGTEVPSCDDLNSNECGEHYQNKESEEEGIQCGSSSANNPTECTGYLSCRNP